VGIPDSGAPVGNAQPELGHAVQGPCNTARAPTRAPGLPDRLWATSLTRNPAVIRTLTIAPCGLPVTDPQVPPDSAGWLKADGVAWEDLARNVPAAIAWLPISGTMRHRPRRESMQCRRLGSSHWQAGGGTALLGLPGLHPPSGDFTTPLPRPRRGVAVTGGGWRRPEPGGRGVSRRGRDFLERSELGRIRGSRRRVTMSFGGSLKSSFGPGGFMPRGGGGGRLRQGDPHFPGPP
jgi:hypothetical protein